MSGGMAVGAVCVEEREVNQSLEEIETLWSDVFRAHQGPEEAARSAKARLMLRYIRAVRRYLVGVLHDADAAEELTQEFAVRFLRGDFVRADPRRGRFRDFLRTSARNLVNDYYRRRKVRPIPMPPDALDPANPDSDSSTSDLDRQFLQGWRKELSRSAMAALALHQSRTGQPFHDVLGLKTDHPELTSAQMAGFLSIHLGRPVNSGWVRQTLRRAREKFVDLLLDEVALSLEGPTPEELEQELIDLDLLDYCREGLRRRSGTG
jgi:DNA-directed RNA polymerase specialized sigma24 family protein